MAARSVRVTLFNQTNFALSLTASGVTRGEWTAPLRPPASVAAGANVSWKSESDGVATGTEGNARYRIGYTDGDLSIHWRNPYVGTNFFEQSVSGRFGLYFEGGKGNDAEVVYSLIPNRRVAVPGFTPSRQGFSFGNSWPSESVAEISNLVADIPIGNTGAGMCGGMSFAARDYFEARRYAPRQTANPRPRDPLFDYLKVRLLQSVTGDLDHYATYSSPLYPDTDNVTGVGRNWVMAREAWPEIRRVVDSGHPCPIGLLTRVVAASEDLERLGHQVCVYAYELDGQQLTLWVYDPNSARRDDITMVLDISRTDQQIIRVTSNIDRGAGQPSIKCFFTEAYRAVAPPAAPNDGGQSGIGLTARTTARLDVFWRGSDGAVATTWTDGNPDNWPDHWAGPITPPGAARADSPVAVVGRDDRRVDVFWIGPDGGIGSTWSQLNGPSWAAPYPVAPPAAAGAGSGLAAVQRTEHHCDLFWVGQDCAIGSTWWDSASGGGWHEHQPFPVTPPGAARPGSPVAAVSRTSGHLDVFWIGPDGAVATTWTDDDTGQTWSTHQPVPITPANTAGPRSGLAAVARTPDLLEVFWIGADGTVATTWAETGGNGWDRNPPVPITKPGAARPDSPVVAVSRDPDHVDVFWIGPDGAVASTWSHSAAGRWQDHRAFPITPPGAAGPGSPLAAVSRQPHRLDVFWQGPDGAVGSTWTEDTRGRGWSDRPPFPISSPTGPVPGPAWATNAGLAAVSRTSEHIDLFWTGPDGAVGSTGRDPDAGWADHPPFPVTPPGAARTDSPCVAVARRPDHLDLFWIGRDGAIGSTWWRPDAGWADHPPFPITPPRAARIGSPLAAAARDGDHLDVFWIGPDGAIGWTWCHSGGEPWRGHRPAPVAPPGAARAGSPLAVVARASGRLDVFWIGADNAIGSTWWDVDQGDWGAHQPFAITSPNAARPDSPLAVVARDPDHLDVFWIGPDGAVGTTWWTSAEGGDWWHHHPFRITPPLAATPGSSLAAVGRDARRLDVFWQGVDGAIGTTWSRDEPGAAWVDHEPFPVTPPGAARPGSALAVVARTPRNLDVFWQRPDGAIGSTWSSEDPGTTWADHQPFPVTPPAAARQQTLDDELKPRRPWNP